MQTIPRSRRSEIRILRASTLRAEVQRGNAPWSKLANPNSMWAAYERSPEAELRRTAVDGTYKITISHDLTYRFYTA